MISSYLQHPESTVVMSTYEAGSSEDAQGVGCLRQVPSAFGALVPCSGVLWQFSESVLSAQSLQTDLPLFSVVTHLMLSLRSAVR